jgi:LPXTG-motif cell wall-anchored protein
MMPTLPAPAPRRFALIDALRGLAIVQMIAFHFTHNLSQFGWVEVVVNRDQPWAAWRVAIVTQFLLLVGVSQMLRAKLGPTPRAFWRRWAQIAAAAAVVSFGSWLVFGPRWIAFGILHFIAVALLLAQPLLRLGAANLLLGLLALAVGAQVSDPSFDAVPARLLGLATELPSTEDWVPLFPWIGVVLLGLGLGALWRRRAFALPGALAALEAAAPRFLTLLGSWPLTVYLAHEPILAGIIWSFGKLAGRG